MEQSVRRAISCSEFFFHNHFKDTILKFGLRTGESKDGVTKELYITQFLKYYRLKMFNAFKLKKSGDCNNLLITR